MVDRKSELMINCFVRSCFPHVIPLYIVGGYGVIGSYHTLT